MTLETNSPTIKNLQKILADLGQGKISYALARELIAAEFQSTGMYSNPQETADRYLAAAGVGANAPGAAATGGGATTGGGVVATPKPAGFTPAQSGWLQENPVAEWNRAFNLPSVGGNPFQDWLSTQVTPAYSALAARNLLNIPKGGQPEAFSTYLGSQGQGIPMAGQTALGALKEARGLGGLAQETFLGNLRGARAEGGAGASLQALLQAGLQGRGFAAPFARAASRNVPGYEEQWNTETLGGSQLGSEGLLNYLMKQLGF